MVQERVFLFGVLVRVQGTAGRAWLVPGCLVPGCHMPGCLVPGCPVARLPGVWLPGCLVACCLVALLPGCLVGRFCLVARTWAHF